MRASWFLLAMLFLYVCEPRLGLATFRQSVTAESQTAIPSSADPTGALNWKAAAWLVHEGSKTAGTLSVDNQGITLQPDKGSSLRWSFEELSSVELGPRSLIVKTYEPRGWHAPGTRQIRFRLQTNFPPAVAGEIAQRVQRPSRNGDPIEKRESSAALPVHHRATWGGGSNGVLRFHEGGIDYVSPGGADSRSWRWADIETLSSPDPFHLIVFAYLETYSFDLKQPLKQTAYDRLTDELYRHHDELRGNIRRNDKGGSD